MKASQKSTFKTIFLIQKGKCRADGKAPILARITVNKLAIRSSDMDGY